MCYSDRIGRLGAKQVRLILKTSSRFVTKDHFYRHDPGDGAQRVENKPRHHKGIHWLLLTAAAINTSSHGHNYN
jgi:hypothetical protein